jgi:ferrous iron transport protein A
MAETVREGGMTERPEEAAVLADVVRGRKVRIVRVDAGLGLQSRLIGMGLIPGAEVEIYRNDFAGPMVLRVRHGRVALGRGMARKIIVS